MKKCGTVLAAAVLGLALSLFLAPGSEAASLQPAGGQEARPMIDSPKTSSHHHGGGSYGHGRHRGGRW